DSLLISTSYLFRNWRKGRDNFLNAKNKIGKNRKTGGKKQRTKPKKWRFGSLSLTIYCRYFY
ncbi:hypothetical protein, partial [Segatella salivae]|uniref:hypothetical protein n=1 Tax=Segatella salivae TaxID=228604 RepID=UPI00241E63C5